MRVISKLNWKIVCCKNYILLNRLDESYCVNEKRVSHYGAASCGFSLTQPTVFYVSFSIFSFGRSMSDAMHTVNSLSQSSNENLAMGNTKREIYFPLISKGIWQILNGPSHRMSAEFTLVFNSCRVSLVR